MGPYTNFSHQHNIRAARTSSNTLIVSMHDNAKGPIPNDNSTTPTSGLVLSVDETSRKVELIQPVPQPSKFYPVHRPGLVPEPRRWSRAPRPWLAASHRRIRCWRVSCHEGSIRHEPRYWVIQSIPIEMDRASEITAKDCSLRHEQWKHDCVYELEPRDGVYSWAIYGGDDNTQHCSSSRSFRKTGLRRKR